MRGQLQSSRIFQSNYEISSEVMAVLLRRLHQTSESEKAIIVGHLLARRVMRRGTMAEARP